MAAPTDYRNQYPMVSKAFNPTGAGGMMPPPPPASGPVVTGRDKVLLQMQQQIYKFYKKYNKAKLRKSVIAIAMQIWWDDGLIVLNHFLKEKYGKCLKVDHDFLDDFDRAGEDITVVSRHELNVEAGNKHLMVAPIVKTNNANFFLMDKKKNTEMFEAAKKRRDALGNKPVTSLFVNTSNKRASPSGGGQFTSAGIVPSTSDKIPRSSRRKHGKRRTHKNRKNSSDGSEFES